MDDCISVALGGNDNYAEVMQSGNSTGMIYLTPYGLPVKKNEKGIQRHF